MGSIEYILTRSMSKRLDYGLKFYNGIFKHASYRGHLLPPIFTQWLGVSTRPAETSDQPWYSTEICQFAPQTTIYYGYTWTTEGTTTSTPSEMKPGGLINAYGVVVAWQESNSNDPATATATTTTDMTTPTSDSTGGSSRLSTGAKAGIGVGIAVGAIMLLALLAFFLLRRRKQPRSSSPRPESLHANPVELDSGPSRVYELSSTALYEADDPIKSPGHPPAH
ncbi:hypothetical protein N7486_003413 [Penicillium sp. IBT 16267x]|nr:hypothetical protein N7486_003413 [Penicillium sp. IBT 16267x]